MALQEHSQHLQPEEDSVHRLSAPQSRWLRFRHWWNGNWSELPAWWKPRSRGKYITAISVPVALGVFYAIGEFTVHAARGQTDLGIRFLLVLPIAVVPALAVVIPATFLVARISYRRNQRRKHQDCPVRSDSRHASAGNCTEDT